MRAPILAALVFAACGDVTSPGFSTGPGVTIVSAATNQIKPRRMSNVGTYNVIAKAFEIA